MKEMRALLKNITIESNTDSKSCRRRSFVLYILFFLSLVFSYPEGRGRPLTFLGFFSVVLYSFTPSKVSQCSELDGGKAFTTLLVPPSSP